MTNEMIQLYQFTPAWGLPNPSSFCMKLETYLRMADIPYQIAPDADVRKAPKGKMPYIQHRGRAIADTELIIEYLKKNFGDKLDQDLSPAERATAQSIRCLVEEHLYWAVLYSRWAESENWKINKQTFFGALPPVVRTILAEIVRRQVLKSLKGHGMGRHQRDEIYHFGKVDLLALSDLLGSQSFFMGERPTSVDASIYGLLANILWVPIESPLKEHGKTLDNLASYCERMKERFI